MVPPAPSKGACHVHPARHRVVPGSGPRRHPGQDAVRAVPRGAGHPDRPGAGRRRPSHRPGRAQRLLPAHGGRIWPGPVRPAADLGADGQRPAGGRGRRRTGGLHQRQPVLSGQRPAARLHRHRRRPLSRRRHGAGPAAGRQRDQPPGRRGPGLGQGRRGTGPHLHDRGGRGHPVDGVRQAGRRPRLRAAQPGRREDPGPPPRRHDRPHRRRLLPGRAGGHLSRARRRGDFVGRGAGDRGGPRATQGRLGRPAAHQEDRHSRPRRRGRISAGGLGGHRRAQAGRGPDRPPGAL